MITQEEISNEEVLLWVIIDDVDLEAGAFGIIRIRNGVS